MSEHHGAVPSAAITAAVSATTPTAAHGARRWPCRATATAAAAAAAAAELPMACDGSPVRFERLRDAPAVPLRGCCHHATPGRHVDPAAAHGSATARSAAHSSPEG